LNNKAFILKTCGEFGEAEELYNEVVKKYALIYGENSQNVIITMHNLATCLRDNKKPEKALELFDKIIENIEIAEVKPSIKANIYNSAGGCYRSMKQYKKTDELLQKAYELTKENFGDNTLPIATIYNNMGLSYKDQARFEEAKECYEKALQIRKEFLPEDHPDVIAIKHNLGQLFYDNGDKDNAMKYFNNNIEILEKQENNKI
jgi:tetratricopeptide (TPR) repeat protein